MRLTVGFVLAYGAVTTLLSSPPVPIAIVSVLLIIVGVLLTIGLCTPIVGVLVALVEVYRLLTIPADRMVCFLIASLGAALAMLGPGSWSVDARLFGWKRIEPPPRKRQPSSSPESSR
jgi:uncharacterized membrane protein YphA (DoxX/SURF4 family)